MSAARAWIAVLGVVAIAVGPARAFYLPGVAPKEFEDGDRVEIKVNKLTSTKTQLPYDYYSLPFCRPAEVNNAAENLGEVLHGSVIKNSPFDIRMGESSFKVLCRKQLSDSEVKLFETRIREEYRIHMIMDNLPAATKMYREMADGKVVTMYDRGYSLGYVGPANAPMGGMTALPDKKAKGMAYINNHLRFVIKFHKDESFTGARIVGFEVEPLSVNHKYKGEFTEDLTQLKLETVPVGPDLPPQRVSSDAGGASIIFTYDVKWEHSDIRWASRWDLYLYMGDDQVHWFSIINSLAIVLLLTGIVAMIMMRTLRRDLNRYNEVDKEDLQEESGWKLVHGDVFRPPPLPLLLASSAGTGVQLFLMSFISILCAMLGFLSPANRGGLLTATVLLYVLMGIPAGYYSAYLYKSLKGAEWQKCTLCTALFYPGVVFLLIFLLNFFMWGKGSSAALPFGTMVALLAMWFGISVPLVFLGAFFGYKAKLPDQPVRTNEIPRQVPLQAWYMQGAFNILMGGILPFGAIFIELFFIMTSIWLQRFYYVFGFLMIVLLILVITCSEISIVLCYFQLCNEDYHWWWRAFLTSGSSAAYLFLYSIFYFVTKLEIEKFVSGLLFFGYMAIASLIFFVMTGTIGFYACYWFVRKIFSEVKVD
mmetsp:Transcript_23057/g.62585  ORF Transcript_23057/g.62585 Transcript_23057/m.62585 type:complete len:649 (+) Transcript_23057:54-2000(+)